MFYARVFSEKKKQKYFGRKKAKRARLRARRGPIGGDPSEYVSAAGARGGPPLHPSEYVLAAGARGGPPLCRRRARGRPPQVSGISYFLSFPGPRIETLISYSVISYRMGVY